MYRIFALFILALTLGTFDGAASSAARIARRQHHSVSQAERRHAIRHRGTAAPEGSTLLNMRPGREVVSFWNADASAWVPAIEITYSYDTKGDKTMAVAIDYDDASSYIRVLYTYDDRGRLIDETNQGSMDQGWTWYNTTRNVKEYDSRVADFVTLRQNDTWRSSEWLTNYANRYPITRNASGTVTAVDRESLLDGSYDPIAKLRTTTDADGTTVTGLRIDELEAYGTQLRWAELVDLRQIVWQNTDGQTLGFDIADYARGTNRIRSALMFYGDAYDGRVSGVYSSENEGTMYIDFANGDRYQTWTKVTDAATGSYEEGIRLDLVEYEEEVPEPYTELQLSTVSFDSHGNVTEESGSFAVNGETLAHDVTRYEYTYTPEGLVAVMVVSYLDPDTDMYVPDTRTEYFDYADPAGIDSPEIAGADVAYRDGILDVTAAEPATVAVYTIDGTQVAAASGRTSFRMDIRHLPAGVYLARIATASATSTIKILR